MPESFNLLRDVFKYEIRPFLSYYKDTSTAWATGTISTVCWITSSILGSTILQVFAVSALLFPAAVLFTKNRPFGIQVSCTPTTVVEGQREPDKIAEDKEEVVIENGKAVISARVTIASFIDEFSIHLHSSQSLTVELRAKPRQEHTYDPSENILSCDQITERQFPMTIEIYPPIDPEIRRKHYEFEMVENKSQRKLATMDVMNYGEISPSSTSITSDSDAKPSIISSKN